MFISPFKFFPDANSGILYFEVKPPSEQFLGTSCTQILSWISPSASVTSRMKVIDSFLFNTLVFTFLNFNCGLVVYLSFEQPAKIKNEIRDINIFVRIGVIY